MCIAGRGSGIKLLLPDVAGYRRVEDWSKRLSSLTEEYDSKLCKLKETKGLTSSSSAVKKIVL
jgi:hypothetical protein